MKEGGGQEKSRRSTYIEYVRPGTTIDGYCAFHTSEGLPGEINAFAHQTLLGAMDTPTLIDTSKYAHIQPVRMRAMTVVGLDPYNSATAVPKASPVNDDGTPIPKAIPVDPAGDPDSVPVLKLAPPPPMKIEL